MRPVWFAWAWLRDVSSCLSHHVRWWCLQADDYFTSPAGINLTPIEINFEKIIHSLVCVESLRQVLHVEWNRWGSHNATWVLLYMSKCTVRHWSWQWNIWDIVHKHIVKWCCTWPRIILANWLNLNMRMVYIRTCCTHQHPRIIYTVQCSVHKQGRKF